MNRASHLGEVSIGRIQETFAGLVDSIDTGDGRVEK